MPASTAPAPTTAPMMARATRPMVQPTARKYPVAFAERQADHRDRQRGQPVAKRDGQCHGNRHDERDHADGPVGGCRARKARSGGRTKRSSRSRSGISRLAAWTKRVVEKLLAVSHCGSHGAS